MGYEIVITQYTKSGIDNKAKGLIIKRQIMDLEEK
jgi:hypothetical protein